MRYISRFGCERREYYHIPAPQFFGAGVQKITEVRLAVFHRNTGSGGGVHKRGIVVLGAEYFVFLAIQTASVFPLQSV
jgi:hypothetical protein